MNNIVNIENIYTDEINLIFNTYSIYHNNYIYYNYFKSYREYIILLPYKKLYDEIISVTYLINAFKENKKIRRSFLHFLDKRNKRLTL